MVAVRRLPPSIKAFEVARSSAQALEKHMQDDQPLKVKIVDTEQDQLIELPAIVVSMLIQILEDLADGKGVTIIPVNAELTTVQAAEILNVSRPFLINLLENGKIPYHKVGTHRRIRMEDVINYKEQIDQSREEVLDKLATEAQELGLGY